MCTEFVRLVFEWLRLFKTAAYGKYSSSGNPLATPNPAWPEIKLERQTYRSIGESELTTRLNWPGLVVALASTIKQLQGFLVLKSCGLPTSYFYRMTKSTRNLSIFEPCCHLSTFYGENLHCTCLLLNAK